MPAAHRNKCSVTSKKSSDRKTATEKLSLKTLISTAEASKDKHGFAQSTIGSYERALHQAQKWLQGQLEAEASFECPPGCLDIAEPSESWTLEELRSAFEKTPNRASPAALTLFIATRCFTKSFNGKESKKGIAEQTHAAWKKFWDNSDPNGLYRGQWHWDPEKKIARGNPAHAPEVREIVNAVIARDAALGERQHSAAMSKEYMDRIMAWSEQECPQEVLSSIIPSLNHFVEVRLKVTKHLLMRAFASSGWTLWTRNFELAKLRAKHYKQHMRTQDEYQWEYDECHLEQRKGWQHQMSREGDLESHKYEIHLQPEMPSVDMHFHMNIWMNFLKAFVYGRELEPNDFIFPSVTSTGTVQPEVPISHNTIQKWLDEFAEGANIELGTTRLTTHCFRRGGAQYRFMYAPIGKCWSLTTIRWWGGWTQGEHRDTLIRYLLDELYHYEDGHGDALHPIKSERSTSLLNESGSLQVPTVASMTQILKAGLDEFAQNFQATTCHSHRCPSATCDGAAHHGERRTCSSTMPSSTGIQPAVSRSQWEVNGGSSSQSPDEPDVFLRIPKIIKPRKDRLDVPPRWRQVVDHWLKGDPSVKNSPPLKDWNQKWIKGRYKKMYGQVYYQHKLVATEFLERFKGDEAAFRQAWPEAMEGFTALFNAIQRDRKAKGLSKPRNSKYRSLESSAIV
ncbi:hypothetical protein BU17DRAFT_55462 [Hysterangium stoloniferum]|nr:hypothetical protein BU17DRAFT_55462 [Hysterangium stoloniferum]